MCHRRHWLLQVHQLHVFCGILSPKLVYGVLCCPKCFLLVTMYGTIHAHLLLMATVVGPLPNEAPILAHLVHASWWTLKWIMRMLNSQG